MVFRVLAAAVAVVLTGGSLAAYAAYASLRHDWHAIKRVNVRRDLSYHPRPATVPNAMNILLIGSDSRAGANSQFGANIVGQRSDTIMIVHISPGAHRVVVLSIPRDSVVPILKCAPEGGSPGQSAQPAGYVEQINATFAYGGPGCLWETIEQTTGIRISDFIELTFTGFEHVINDIGGVSVCLPVAIHDPGSLLNLSAGVHHVYGREALAFWRARYIGEGSDLQRINRDQYLMASLLQGIERSGLARSPAKILRVIQDVVGHGYVSTDSQLSATRLFAIAAELRGLPPGAVQFIETPTVPYPGDPMAWVEWPPQAHALFAAIARDTRVPTATVSTAGDTLRTPAIGNAVGLAGGGTRLAGAGSPASAAAGLSPSASASASASPGTPAAASTRNLASQYGGLSGNVSICGDAAAFAGPDGTN